MVQYYIAAFRRATFHKRTVRVALLNFAQATR